MPLRVTCLNLAHSVEEAFLFTVKWGFDENKEFERRVALSCHRSSSTATIMSWKRNTTKTEAEIPRLEGRISPPWNIRETIYGPEIYGA